MAEYDPTKRIAAKMNGFARDEIQRNRIEELEAENARLREAMKDIATPAPHGMTPDMRIEVLRDVARAALKETDK